MRQRPFRPFTVELDNGTHIPVDHPESILLVFDLFVGIRTAAGQSYLLGPGNISAVRFNGNGQRRRKR
jgi:hypothetical protein